MDGLVYIPARKISPSLFFPEISILPQGRRGAEEKALSPSPASEVNFPG
jgi:hypothetical protein